MNINPELIKEFMRLSDNFEQDIRKDERRKYREELLARIAAETDPQRRGVGQRGPDRRGFRDGTKLQKLYRCLVNRPYAVTRNTLIRETGMTELALPKAIQELRARGYNIKMVRKGFRLPRYKLAS